MTNASLPPLPGKTRIVDLFAGPGGLDVAARWLGLEVTGVEWSDDACETRTAAHLDTQPGDVRDFSPSDDEFDGCNVLAGGPPCQTYTVAGAGAGRRALDLVRTYVRRMADGEDVRSGLAELDDDRTGLVLEPLRWVLEAMRAGNPYEAIILEQVPAVLPVWESYAEVLGEVGYNAEFGVLCAEQFGVPQTRRRAILIARRDVRPRMPDPTHRRYRKNTDVPDSEATLLPWRSMADDLGTTYPFRVISNYGTGGDPKARGVRSSAEPAATVTGKISRNRVETSSGVRRFTMQEAGRLQTFPEDYPWRGRDIAQQIGNAIPPRLGVHILAAALGLTDRVNEEFFQSTVGGIWIGSEFAMSGELAAVR
ncbi:DNA cytosine methyltransferase [Rhodococcus aetherivorans]